MGYRRIVSTCLAFAVSAAACAPAAAAVPFSSTAQYAGVLRTFNPHLSLAQSGALADRVRMEAQYYRLDARLLVALVAIESSWHPSATSPVGAGGLGQLMPGTAAGLGVHAYRPYENLNGTAHYLRGLLDRFSNYDQATRYEYALAGYNAGPYAVARFGGIPPYAETQNYVRNVMGVFHRLAHTLSAHIDAGAHAQLFAALSKPAVKKRRLRPATVAVVRDEAQPAAKPVAPNHKPLLYYFFHHPKPAASAVADAADGLGPDPASIENPQRVKSARSVALSAPSYVAGGKPIHVRVLTTAPGAVTVIARVGSRVVGQTVLPPGVRSATMKGVPAADLQRIVVLYAYANGYDEGHVAVTVLPAAAALAGR